jgi:hypothetical protein
MAYALVGLGVLVVALAVVVVTLHGQVRVLARRLDELGRGAPTLPLTEPSVGAGPAPLRPVGSAGSARSAEEPVNPQPITITDLGKPRPEPHPVRRVSFGTTMIKLAAFSYGVRRALGEETRTLAAVTMQRELKRQQRQRRRARKHDVADSPAQPHGWIS